MTISVQTDLSGTPLPASSGRNVAYASSIIAVPPVRDTPNEQATDFVWSAGRQVPANQTDFFPIGTNPFPNTPLDPAVRGRVSSLLIFCPDMVTAAASYLSFRLMAFKADQIIGGWDSVEIFPRNGIASVSFDAAIDLQPGWQPSVWVLNTDPVNTHFVGVYLYGWLWQKDLVQG